MKKMRFKLLSVIGVSLLGLALCAPAFAGDPGPQKLNLATFKTGSGWYVMGQTMGKIMLKALPKGSTVDVLPYSGGVGNPMLLHKGKAVLGLSFPVEVGQAIKGNPPYKSKMPELRALIGNLDTYWYLFSVRKAIPVKSFRELKAKKYPLKLALLPKGSTGEAATRKVLGAYGITYDDIRSWGGKVTHGSFGTAVEMMKDGQADAFAHVATPGHPAWTRLSTLSKLDFFPIDKDVADKLIKTFGYRMSSLPAGTFRGVEKPIPVLGFATVLMTTTKMSDDVAYIITKSICDNYKELIAAYKGAKVFDPKKATAIPVPFHAGALKYYKEAGIVK